MSLHSLAYSRDLVALSDLSRLRGRPALLYVSGSFSHETSTVLYDCLRRLTPQDGLDLVLRSYGGDPQHARRLGVLLRSFTRQLSILVLDYASSAATLLCLAADELLMSPLSSLSPIDPQLLSAQPVWSRNNASDERQLGPSYISTEEARLFGEMAHEWFGVGESAEERLALMQIVCQRIFPTTLTTFFRADREVREGADELLRFHQSDETVRKRICDRLIMGFSSHGHVIHPEEARALGLPVREVTREEEECLWRLHSWSQDTLFRTREDPETPGHLFAVQAVLAGPRFMSQYVIPVEPSEKGGEKRVGSKAGWRDIPLAP